MYLDAVPYVINIYIYCFFGPYVMSYSWALVNLLILQFKFISMFGHFNYMEEFGEVETGIFEIHHCKKRYAT